MIYFKDGNKAETLLDLLQAGFSHDCYFVETYSDSEYTKTQTPAKRRRSFSDLIEIARTYFPETTEKELMIAIKDAKLFGTWCHNINKVTFMGSDAFRTSNWNKEVIGLDGYSTDTLNKLLQDE